MKKRKELLACLIILSLAGNSMVVYGDTAKTNNVSTGEENPSQEKPEERQQGEHEKHEMDEGDSNCSFLYRERLYTVQM